MGQTVRLSDALVQDARFVGSFTDRSTAEQIEFWADLGKSVESILRGREVLKLLALGKTKPLSECLAEVETLGGSDE